MEFKPVVAEDKDIIEKYMKQVDSRSCDFSFASVYLWRGFYHMEYALCEGMIVFRSNEEQMSFSFPLGEGDPKPVIEEVLAYCKERKIRPVFHSISRGMEEYLQEHFPGQFDIEFDRDVADYIYETQALIELKGRKYHGKKNHINKFNKVYDWSYEEITPDNTEECLEMLARWKQQNCTPENLEKHAEICVSEASLKEREFLGLKGGLIRVNGDVAAFAVCEKITPDTFCGSSSMRRRTAPMSTGRTMWEIRDCVRRSCPITRPFSRRRGLRYIRKREVYGGAGITILTGPEEPCIIR